MKYPAILSIFSTISALALIHSSLAARIPDGVYTIKSHQGFILVDNMAIPGEYVTVSKNPSLATSLSAQWSVVQNKAASNPNLISIQNRRSNLFLTVDHSTDTRRNPYMNDEPVRMQEERQDWYLDSAATEGYFDIESPVMGHGEKAYAIKSPDLREEKEKGGAREGEVRLYLRDVGELPSTHLGWRFEAVVG
ncbi:hypothetical protein BGX33_008370 [Mortierella sp. NVP41]|nr:hypothetical protein BGX33_008370 [Mortierella sp. NVP41]